MVLHKVRVTGKVPQGDEEGLSRVRGKLKRRKSKNKSFLIYGIDITQEPDVRCTLIFHLWKYFILRTLPKTLIKYLPKRGWRTNRINN